MQDCHDEKAVLFCFFLFTNLWFDPELHLSRLCGKLRIAFEDLLFTGTLQAARVSTKIARVADAR
jgi:hypothetical protein